MMWQIAAGALIAILIAGAIALGLRAFIMAWGVENQTAKDGAAMGLFLAIAGIAAGGYVVLRALGEFAT